MPDTLGSTIALMSATHSVSSSLGYWPYGVVADASGAVATPFLYVGTRGYRSVASHTYVRIRPLLSNLARWGTEDPIASQPYYLYADGSPTSRTDATGLRAQPPGPPMPPLLDTVWQSTYGHYCGVELWKRNPPGRTPLDPLDTCCQEHDYCYLRNKCPSPGLFGVFSYWSPACKKCDPNFCACMKDVRCHTFACKLMLFTAQGLFCPRPNEDFLSDCAQYGP